MKTLLIIIAILIAGTGGYLVYDNFLRAPADFDFAELQGFDLPETDLYLSDLGQVELPTVELGDDLNISSLEVGFDDIGLQDDFGVPEVSIQDPAFNLTAPQISPTMPASSDPSAGEEAPGGWEPNEADCAAFAAAPDCSYVPAANQEMCLACKEAGF